MRIWLAALLVFVMGLAPLPVKAASPDEIDALYAALRNDELLAILREEGQSDADRVREEMFPGRGGPVWDRRVAELFAPERLSGIFRASFEEALRETDVAGLTAFFVTEPGRTIIRLEVEGRRAIMAEPVETAAHRAFARVEEEGGTRLKLLRDFAAESDLVGRNVASAMNASLSFYQGLAEGGGVDLDEQGVLADIWTREPEIRADTESWVFAYMTMSYEPLSDADFSAYVDLMASPEGRDLNAALFAGFEKVFRDVSFGVGKLASGLLAGDDL